MRFYWIKPRALPSVGLNRCDPSSNLLYDALGNALLYANPTDLVDPRPLALPTAPIFLSLLICALILKIQGLNQSALKGSLNQTL